VDFMTEPTSLDVALQPDGAADSSASSTPLDAVTATRQRELTRRTFLGATGGVVVGAAAGAASAYAARDPKVAAPPTSAAASVPSAAPPAVDLTKSADPAALYKDLVARTEKLRIERAQTNAAVPVPAHPNNDDEALYPNKLGSDTRGLPHNDLGEVDGAAWRAASNNTAATCSRAPIQRALPTTAPIRAARRPLQR